MCARGVTVAEKAIIDNEGYPTLNWSPHRNAIELLIHNTKGKTFEFVTQK